MKAWRRQTACIKNQLLFKTNHLNYRCEDYRELRIQNKGQKITSPPGFQTAACQILWQTLSIWLYQKQENWLSAVGGAGQSHILCYMPNSPDEHDFHSDLPLHLSKSIKIIYYIKFHCSFLPNKCPDIYKQITLSSLVTSLPKQTHLVSIIFCYTVICQPQITFVASSGITTHSHP